MRRNFRNLLRTIKGGKRNKSYNTFKKIQISNCESKKSVSIFEESVEDGEISSSGSVWKTSLDELFVTHLNRNNDKIGKPIQNYLDHFINTSWNHMSNRSCLVSQSKN